MPSKRYPKEGEVAAASPPPQEVSLYLRRHRSGKLFSPLTPIYLISTEWTMFHGLFLPLTLA